MAISQACPWMHSLGSSEEQLPWPLPLLPALEEIHALASDHTCPLLLVCFPQNVFYLFFVSLSLSIVMNRGSPDGFAKPGIVGIRIRRPNKNLSARLLKKSAWLPVVLTGS